MESIYIFFDRNYDDPIDFIAAIPENKFQEFLEEKFKELERKAEEDSAGFLRSDNLIDPKIVQPYKRYHNINALSNGESWFGVAGKVSYFSSFDIGKTRLISNEVAKGLSYVKIPITQ